MDTGYVNLIDDDLRDRGPPPDPRRPSAAARSSPAPSWPTGPGDRWDRDAYLRRIEAIADARRDAGHLPVVRPDRRWTTTRSSTPTPRSAGTATGSSPSSWARRSPRSAGSTRSRSIRGLLGIRSCVGAKHSSLRREPEWRRLVERDRLRPDFRVYTGNDLAIDMVMYGSDYLLGLSTFAPDLFARRDALWEAGDPGVLRAERPAPVPRLLRLPAAGAGLQALGRDVPPAPGLDRRPTGPTPRSPTRPASDREVLRDIGRRLGVVPEA